jgi:hypothetical protein
MRYPVLSWVRGATLRRLVLTVRRRLHQPPTPKTATFLFRLPHCPVIEVGG